MKVQNMLSLCSNHSLKTDVVFNERQSRAKNQKISKNATRISRGLTSI